MRIEEICIDKERKVSLTAYLQESGGEFANIGKRPGMLVLPGGGYQMCSDREADPVAFVYLKVGYQVFILRYSVKENAAWPTPLEDYEAAMGILLEKSDDWGLYPDKIAVTGFSAGAHLAAAAATMAKNRPAAAILGYPVLNQDVKDCNPTAPSLIGEVDGKTCPCFIFASRTDNIVPVSNSLEFLQALEKKGIAFECHIYAYGPHGFSTCDSSVQEKNALFCDRIKNWVPDSIGWLKDVLGDFSDGGMTKPACSLVMNADDGAFLSVDCTLGYLMGKPQAREFMQDILKRMSASSHNPMSEGMDMEATMKMAGKMTFREILAYGNTPDEVVDQLDRKLRQIPNG